MAPTARVIEIDFVKMVEVLTRLRTYPEYKGGDIYLQAVRDTIGDQSFEWQGTERQQIKELFYIYLYTAPVPIKLTSKPEDEMVNVDPAELEQRIAHLNQMIDSSQNKPNKPE